MKNFVVYECLLPCLVCCALMVPLIAVHACVSMGPGDTYTVDAYGSSMRPTNEEMSPSSSGRGGGLIWEKMDEPTAPTLMNKLKY